MNAFKKNEAAIKFDLLGYKGGRCRKVALHEQRDDNLKNEVSLVQCPYSKLYNEDNKPPKDKFFVHYYIASNVRKHSTTLFDRENQKGKNTEKQFNIIELPMEPVHQYAHRERYMPLTFFDNIQPQKSNHEMENEINSVKGDLRMPHTLERLHRSTVRNKARAQGPLRTNYDKWFNDYITINFSRVRKTTQIYQRFIRTYGSIDTCQLSVEQKVALCTDILRAVDNLEYNLAYFDNELNLACSKKNVILIMREAEDLETSSMWMWECPTRNNRFNKHFLVGKNHLKDAATIYQRIEVKSQYYYFPHILITEINKYKLAEIGISTLRIGGSVDD